MREKKKPEYSEETPDDELQKMPILMSENLGSERDSNPHSSIGGRRLEERQTL